MWENVGEDIEAGVKRVWRQVSGPIIQILPYLREMIYGMAGELVSKFPPGGGFKR